MTDSVYEKDARIIGDAISLFTGAGRGLYSYSRSEIEVDERRREVYSYGRHFPLFRFVPRALNGWRDLFLINGDAVGSQGWGNRSRTPAHQASARELIRATGLADCVIPFSALTGAGIELDSVRIVDVRPDAEWTETVTVRTLQELPRWNRTERYTREHSSSRLEDMPSSYGREVWRLPTAEELAAGLADTRGTIVSGQSAYLPRLPDADGLYRWTTSHKRPVAPNEDGSYSYDRRVHRLGDSLISAVRNGRRARFLSSFDTNEAPPLYFLAQVPRGAGASVAMALDSLAPRAVHAAIARGREVKRQGDVFFIDTELTREELEARGATFARLTQWTRDARARKGEVNYRAPQSAKERRREDRFARQVWRERRADTLARAGTMRDRSAARLETREAWRELEARHTLERLAAIAAGAPLDSPISLACVTCGAAIGAACSRADIGSEHINARLEFERLANNGLHWERGRSSLEARQLTERSSLRHERRSKGTRYSGGPDTGANGRRRARRDYLAAVARVDDARARARDSYRDSLGSNGTVAIVLWREARQTAAARFRPDDFAPDRISARRERARRALAIYGTAHTATELARVRGSVYARGVVSHRRDIETGRGWDSRESDHRPVVLAPDRWYLAVRNTVPRQREARP